MTNYLIYPDFTDGEGFPSEVNQSIAESPEIEAMIDSEVTEQIPSLIEPLVTTALAQSAIPANAAAAAVENAMVGKQLAILQDNFDNSVDAPGFVVVDALGNNTSVEVTKDTGKPTARFAKDMGEAGGFLGGQATYDQTVSLTDGDGNILPDGQWTLNGYFAEDLIDRISPRVEQRRMLNAPRIIKRLPTATDAKLVSVNLNAVKYMLMSYLPTRFPGTSPITTMGGITENDIRHPGAAVFSIATAIYTGIYDSAAETTIGKTVAQAKTDILRVILGAVNDHRTVKGSTGWGTDGTVWVWQDMAWAQMYSAAAWMIKNDVDPALWTKIQTMVTAESNTTLSLTPDPPYQYRYDGVDLGVGGFGNSRAEENAWMAGAISTAALVNPTVPNKATWETQIKRWMASAASMPSDVLLGNTVQGIDMSALNGWNVLQNGIIINHGIIHPDYMCAMGELAWAAGVLKAFDGQRIPASYVHNGEWVYRALVDVRTNGAPIYTPVTGTIFYPQGTDWGPGRYGDKAMMDVSAHCLGLDWRATTPAATWANLHLQTCLDMQNRFSDGHTYLDSSEDGYVGREPWLARNMALAMLAARIPLTTRYTYV